MARKKTDRSSTEAPVELTPGKLLARKIALWAFVVGLGATAVGLGFSKLKRHVEVRYATDMLPPVVVIKNQPAWMRPELAEKIVNVARPVAAASSFDRDVLRDVHDQLMSSPDVGPWISNLKSVRRAYGNKPGDTIEIDAEFRAPIALVHYDNLYWLVDSAGVRLPEAHRPENLTRAIVDPDGKVVLRVIEGVRRRPADPGLVWPGGDLAAGLELVRGIYDKPFAQEIVKVDVANFGGRVNASAAQLVLVTRHNTEIRWGRPITGKDSYIAELDTGRKLQYLEKIVQQYGRVDAGQPWIDIRFDRVMFPKAPVNPESPSTASVDSTTRMR